jgi:hypothetical protein
VEALTMTLAGFLLARIAEEEHDAREAAPWSTGSRDEGQPVAWRIHMRNWAPARVLAECEARRSIVDYYAKCIRLRDVDRHESQFSTGELTGCEMAVRAMAAAYADHPDYDPA